MLQAITSSQQKLTCDHFRLLVFLLFFFLSFFLLFFCQSLCNTVCAWLQSSKRLKGTLVLKYAKQCSFLPRVCARGDGCRSSSCKREKKNTPSESMGVHELIATGFGGMTCKILGNTSTLITLSPYKRAYPPFSRSVMRWCREVSVDSTRFLCSLSFLEPVLTSSNVLTRDRTCFSMSSILF